MVCEDAAVGNRRFAAVKTGALDLSRASPKSIASGWRYHDCVRQLWWGHRIPVWYCRDCGAEIASGEASLFAVPVAVRLIRIPMF